MRRDHTDGQIAEYLRIRREIQQQWNNEFADIPELQRPFYYDLFAWIHENRLGNSADVGVSEAIESGITINNRTSQSYVQRALKHGWLIAVEDKTDRRRRFVRMSDEIYEKFISACNRALDLVEGSSLFSNTSQAA